jgi:hypothetical protein
MKTTASALVIAALQTLVYLQGNGLENEGPIMWLVIGLLLLVSPDGWIVGRTDGQNPSSLKP